jgi:hypothetical protein
MAESKAGSEFGRVLDSGAEARASWERAATRLRVFANAIASPGAGGTEPTDEERQALTEAIRDALRATDREFEAAGFEAPARSRNGSTWRAIPAARSQPSDS